LELNSQNEYIAWPGEEEEMLTKFCEKTPIKLLSGRQKETVWIITGSYGNRL
jgi:hypothetical protein